MSIQISNIVESESMLQDITAQEIADIIGGNRGGHGGGGGGGNYGGGSYGYPVPYPVPTRTASPFIFDEIGPGNSRRDRFVVSPNGDTFQYNRKGSARSSFAFNPGFASGGYGGFGGY